EELDSVRAGQVGHRAHHPLAPEDLVRERRDIAHVDLAADDRPAGSRRPKREGNELAGRREQDGRVELLRWEICRGAGPLGTELACEALTLLVSFAREREHPTTLMERHLCDDVCRAAE